MRAEADGGWLFEHPEKDAPYPDSSDGSVIEAAGEVSQDR